MEVTCYMHVCTDGYYGFQGCPGAEFFFPNGTFKHPTSMECDQSRIGLSKAQADLFNVRKQELWNLLEESVNSNDLFCNGDDVRIVVHMCIMCPFCF